ncbi:hypothetical protein MKP08_11595 [Erythrobacter sp. LQ02-29]|nr:hypothetical protein [Erythrobacter sp. LQ02-29]MCP9223394.1 hypothetical protein [Erythrobacter sp. LQ02-29]
MQFDLLAFAGLVRSVENAAEETFEVGLIEDPFGDFFHDQRIKLVRAHIRAATGGSATVRSLIALIIAISAGPPGRHGHSCTTIGHAAVGYADEQRGTVYNARSSVSRGSGGTKGGNVIECLFRDELRTLDHRPLIFRQKISPLVELVTRKLSQIMRPREDARDVRVVELAATTRIAVLIQIFSNRSASHRSSVDTELCEVEDLANDQRLFLVDKEFLLFFLPSDFHRARFVTERNGSAWPEPLFGSAPETPASIH